MDERDRSRSPMAPVAQPVIVSNRNAEEMDGTERFETGSGREGERREARPGFGRRAEVGVIGQRQGGQGGGGGGGDQEVPQHRVVRVPDDANRQADDVTTYVHVHGPVNATTTGPMPVTAQGVRVTRRDWYEYTVARTSTVATLNAATAICRAITATVGAAVTAAGPPSQLSVPRTPVQPVQQLLRRAKDELARRAPPAAAQAAGAALPTLAKARIAASERLKAIAASFADSPPTTTSIPAEARNEAIEKALSLVLRIVDATEREEALKMLERILTPGSLQQVRSIYDHLPAWEENRPPPAGFTPFSLRQQFAESRATREHDADVARERDRERERDANRTRRQVEANEAARDLFEDLFATQHHPMPGHLPRGPRMGNAVPSFEMVQIRDLPTMLTVQGMRVPPESRIEDRDEEQVVPTGPSIRSTHTVPLLNSQARLREGYEFEYRRRYGEMVQPVRPPPHPAARSYDTPHPGVVVRATGEENDAAVPMSPLVQQQPRARPPAMPAMDAMVEIMRRQGRQGPQIVSGVPPMQHGVPSSSTGPPTTPSSAKPGVVGSTAGGQTSEGKIIVHKLRRTHRAPGQRREVSGLVGARRLIMEQQALDEKGGVERVEAAPKPDNIRTWTAVVEGAEGSQYEGGVFFFDIDFPQSYPMVRAEGIKIKCLTHTVHPYIRVTGIVDAEAVAQLCFGVKFSEMNYGGVEKSLMIAAAVVSGKLPTATAEQTKQWIDRGRLFTTRYAC